MRYDLVVIGGGSAGLVAAKFALGLGKRVAIVEKNKLGGDCTHFGCVPSKALLRTSHMAHNIKELNEFGLKMDTSSLDTSKAMSHIRQIVSAVYSSETPDIFREEGIDIIEGGATFIDNHTISVSNENIQADKYILATGSSPQIPDIKGLEDINYLTNETIFDLNELPSSVAVLGGGPIGLELASALNGLGVDVAIIEMSKRILPREDRELSNMLSAKLDEDEIKVITNTKVISVEQKNGFVTLNTEGEIDELHAERLLVAVGRKPNINNLGLENAGIEYDNKGVKVDKYLRTTAKNIYAAGDIVPPYQFTHVADYEAVTAARNALIPVFKKSVDYSNIGWCTYTEPELARCGLTEDEAIAEYGRDCIRVFKYSYNHVDRAITDGNTVGMAKYITNKKGYLIGIHILGSRAGEVIHEPMLAKKFKIPFQKIADMVHIYPTYSYAVRQPSKYAIIEILLDNPIVKFIKGIKN
ncbi:MAG: mercuric reductase [Denitrovibrio sp.]|nr:MAG: mercuric reductase [Denitrovibrio sp.]